MKEIEDNNVLIAKFMGWHDSPYLESLGKRLYKADEDGDPIGVDIYKLKYHCEWHAVMPVVEKINAFERVSYHMHGSHVTIHVGWFKKAESHTIDMLNSTYRAVVEFVKWYNSIHD